MKRRELIKELSKAGAEFKKNAPTAKLQALFDSLNKPQPTEQPKQEHTAEGECLTKGNLDPDNPDCIACGEKNSDEYDQCLELTKRNQAASGKPKASGKSKKPAALTNRVKARYPNFEALVAHITKKDLVTKSSIMMDNLIYKGGTVREILARAQEKEKTLGSKHFNGIGDVKKHIAYRRDRHWMIVENVVGEFKLVGYMQDVDEDTQAEFLKAGEEKKAAMEKAAAEREAKAAA